jgi:membrane protease YdiL (CAAX protease family)
LLYLFLGTLLVGFSEELLVRGIVVTSLLDNGYSIVLTGIISSILFGVLHFINYFNGQSFRITLVQVASTALTGINFFVLFIISGTLWVPILLHAIFDFSLLVQGGELNKATGKEKNIESIIVLLLSISALGAVFFI